MEEEQTVKPVTKQKRFQARFPHTFIAIGIVLLILFILSYAVYFLILDASIPGLSKKNSAMPTPSRTLSPTQTPTWKTYTNSEYKFSFMHPSLDSEIGQIAMPINAQVIRCFTNIPENTGGSDRPFDGLCVYVLEGMNQKSVQEYIEQQKNSYKNSIGTEPLISETEMQIGGKKAISLEGFQHQIVYLQLPNNKILWITKGEETKGSFTNIFNQILSTFTFSDSSQKPISTEPVFCTRDAKICPDGSSVGRVGPNCEFSPCP